MKSSVAGVDEGRLRAALAEGMVVRYKGRWGMSRIKPKVRASYTFFWAKNELLSTVSGPYHVWSSNNRFGHSIFNCQLWPTYLSSVPSTSSRFLQVRAPFLMGGRRRRQSLKIASLFRTSHFNGQPPSQTVSTSDTLGQQSRNTFATVFHSIVTPRRAGLQSGTDGIAQAAASPASSTTEPDLQAVPIRIVSPRLICPMVLAVADALPKGAQDLLRSWDRDAK